MWYIWEVKNDKLFRELDMDPLETIRHAKSECHAWFETNIKQEPKVTQIRNRECILKDA